MSKKHINLPKTAFSMKANLPTKEPGIIEYWQKINLYEKLREKSKGKEKFILHDGPPYANGNIHMGTAQRSILKTRCYWGLEKLLFNNEFRCRSSNCKGAWKIS